MQCVMFRMGGTKTLFFLCFRRETDADWDTDLSEDVKGECSSKYGNVELCHVEKDSSVGEIYLRFTDLDGAAKAIVGLNGRFFGGRKVSAE